MRSESSENQDVNHGNEPSDQVPEHLIPDLIERLRICSDLSHDMCKSSLEAVLDTIGQAIPDWRTKCQAMIRILNGANQKSDHLSTDARRLKDIFKSLWSCRNDEQQRSWPIHQVIDHLRSNLVNCLLFEQDEELIRKHLVELTKILSDANPKVSAEIISRNNFENVQMLITYFQMETRRKLRMQLFSVFLEVIRLDILVIDLMLNSVLPSALADELINHKEDSERWTAASLLFTVVFSTGQKPPITLYDHINEKFISGLLDIVEGVSSTGEKLDLGIPMESSLPPVLSFNVHFEERAENRVLRSLRDRMNASQLTENLVSYLNWEEDPTWIPRLESECNRQNSVHKLLMEIFQEKDTAKLFYYNDVRVVIDIIITHLNNLIAGDKVSAILSSFVAIDPSRESALGISFYPF